MSARRQSLNRKPEESHTRKSESSSGSRNCNLVSNGPSGAQANKVRRQGSEAAASELVRDAAVLARADAAAPPQAPPVPGPEPPTPTTDNSSSNSSSSSDSDDEAVDGASPHCGPAAAAKHCRSHPGCHSPLPTHRLRHTARPAALVWTLSLPRTSCCSLAICSALHRLFANPNSALRCASSAMPLARTHPPRPSPQRTTCVLGSFGFFLPRMLLSRPAGTDRVPKQAILARFTGFFRDDWEPLLRAALAEAGAPARPTTSNFDDLPRRLERVLRQAAAAIQLQSRMNGNTHRPLGTSLPPARPALLLSFFGPHAGACLSAIRKDDAAAANQPLKLTAGQCGPSRCDETLSPQAKIAAFG